MTNYKPIGVPFDRTFRNDLNENFKTLDSEVGNQKKRVDDLIVGTTQPSEVVDARGGFPVLRDKLLDVDTQLANNAHKEAHVKKFPRLVPETNDAARIQRAVDSLGVNKGNVILTEDCVLANKVVLPEGVNFINRGGKITRTHSWNVAQATIEGRGNNTVDGLIYDGGSSTINVGADYIYYSDIDFDNSSGVSRVINCFFMNSCGSFVRANSPNIFVIGNYFGDYEDHSVYCGGRGFASSNSESVVVSNNMYNSANSLRPAIKLRNGHTKLIVEGNVGKVGDIFVSLDPGDDVVADKDIEKIVVNNNAIDCKEFLYFNMLDAIVKDIVVVGNTGTSTGTYFIRIGTGVQGAQQNGVNVQRLIVSNNSVSVISFMLLNGDLTTGKNGLTEIKVNNNNVIYSSPAAVGLVGNVNNLYSNNNTYKCTATYAVGNTVFQSGLYAGFGANKSCLINSIDDYLIGTIHSLINENLSGKSVSDSNNYSFNAKRTVFNTTNDAMIFRAISGALAITSQVYLENIQKVGAGTLTMLSGNLITKPIIIGVKTGAGTPTTNADFVGQIYVETTNKVVYTSVSTGSGASDWKSTQTWETGPTGNRPSIPFVGQRFFDTTLGKPIWCKVGGGTPVWVDATGATV